MLFFWVPFVYQTPRLLWKYVHWVAKNPGPAILQIQGPAHATFPLLGSSTISLQIKRRLSPHLLLWVIPLRKLSYSVYQSWIHAFIYCFLQTVNSSRAEWLWRWGGQPELLSAIRYFIYSSQQLHWGGISNPVSIIRKLRSKGAWLRSQNLYRGGEARFQVSFADLLL